MDYDMEHYHCGHCGKYVNPDDGFYGDAEAEPQRVYCNADCCKKQELNFFD